MPEQNETPDDLGLRILARTAGCRLRVIQAYADFGAADVIPTRAMSDDDLRALTKASQELANAANEHAASLRVLAAWQRRYKVGS